MKQLPKYFTFFLIALIFFISVDLDAQCAMCKQAAETSLKNDPNSLARSLNSGILYLMAIPYLMLCFIFRKQIAQIWRKYVRKLPDNTVE